MESNTRNFLRCELMGKGAFDNKTFTLEDISASGARIRTIFKIDIGYEGPFLLELFGHPGLKRHIELKAKCVRLISSSEIIGNEYGIEFEELSEHAKIDLDEIITITAGKMAGGKEHSLCAMHSSVKR